jgi:TRAP-type C4-dicarboxylate transport system substrate-binding protein
VFEDTVNKADVMSKELCDKNFEIFKSKPNTVITDVSDAEMARWREVINPVRENLMKDPNVSEVLQAVDATR